jgi:hypothetical protein
VCSVGWCFSIFGFVVWWFCFFLEVEVGWLVFACWLVLHGACDFPHFSAELTCDFFL